jgi:hypothetical protein
VAAGEIGQQLGEHVAIARRIPQMVVRIDDRQTGFEDLFRPLGQPVRPDRRLHGWHLRRRRGRLSRALGVRRHGGRRGSRCARQSCAGGKQHAS